MSLFFFSILLFLPSLWSFPFKGIQPDFHLAQDFIGNGAGHVAMNLVWAEWQPVLKAPPCTTGQVPYLNLCWTVDTATDTYYRDLAKNGVGLTAILYGSPSWSRTTRQGCPTWGGTGSEIFCAPSNLSHFADFCSFVSYYYRESVQQYVIWNEVQSDDWWSLGGWPNRNNFQSRIETYSDMFWQSRARIKQNAPNANVLVSLDHTFEDSGDEVSGYRILDFLGNSANGRDWHVAIHPYSIQVGGIHFSDSDRPTITFGTLNVLMGYLQSNFPGVSAMITEVGFTSKGDGSSEELQAETLCLAFRQALGTPGITGFIYHRYQDNPGETSAGLFIGLADVTGRQKISWSVWALMDRGSAVGKPNDCGFELNGGALTQMDRYRNPAGAYWVTSRNPLAYGFYRESLAWRLYREPQLNFNISIYDCQVPGTQDHFLSRSNKCEGQFPTGMVGYVSGSAFSGSAPIYRCFNGTYHFASKLQNCENWGRMEQLLGWGINVI